MPCDLQYSSNSSSDLKILSQIFSKDDFASEVYSFEAFITLDNLAMNVLKSLFKLLSFSMVRKSS